MADIYIVAADPGTHDQIYEWYNNRQPSNVGDSGVDIHMTRTRIYNSESYEDEGFSISRGIPIDLGIKCQVISKKTGRPMAYFLIPRSSMAEAGLRLANSIGLIDHGYQGPLIAKVDILDKYVSLMKGGRYFQLVIPEQMADPLNYKIDIHVVKSFDYVTDRGSGGFGSTGK